MKKYISPEAINFKFPAEDILSSSSGGGINLPEIPVTRGIDLPEIPLSDGFDQ